jgi:hypothetical protein
MAREPDPLLELLRGIEHLLRAGEALIAQALPALRDAVATETKRWEARAGEDAAAARVYQVFRALLEILEASESDTPPSSEAKEVRSRPRGTKLTRRRDRWNTRAQ